MRVVCLLCAVSLWGCVTDNPADPEKDEADAAPTADSGPPTDAEPECRGAFEFAPEAVDFGRVPAFEARTVEVMLRNTSTCSVSLESVRIDGPRAFAVFLGEVDPRIDPSVLADPDGDGTPGLAPDGTVVLVVRLTPPSDDAVAGELVVEADGGPYRIPLDGNRAGACLRAEPPTLEFSASPGEEHTATLTLRSCGDAPVTVESATFSEDGDPAYTLVAELSASLPFDLAPQDAGGGTSLMLTVRFAPALDGVFEGTLLVRTNDPRNPLLTVRLLGRSSANLCPIATAEVDEFRVEVGDVVQLDGSGSRDPDGVAGQPLRYEWTVLARPEGSTANPVEEFFDVARPADGGPADDPLTPQVFLFADTPGRYVVELRVSDGQCDATTQVVMIAGTDRAVQVQLTWASGAGTDVDLHLHHPEGAFDGGPLDCFGANPTPDWGAEGADNDPVLDVDDQDGDGPENILLAMPEETGAAGYGVGAMYVADRGRGPATVTVRIFINGALTWEGEEVLQSTGDWWRAARITWPAGDVLPYDP